MAEHIKIPKNVDFILKSLNENGFRAFIVGGCVRDYLLNAKISDYDITTDAKPEDVKKIFKKTIDTGIKHGTVSILLKDEGNLKTYEVTTFRTEGTYSDSRHPDKVTFVSDINEDLSRRDFTINAMAYSDETGLIDEFRGIEDLKNKIIRCVGEPKERFKEDALRMLRAVRFASKLDFNIETETLNAIKDLKENLKNVSKERVNVELTKTLLGKNPSMLRFAFETGLSKYIANDFDKISFKNIIKTNVTHIALSSFFYNDVDLVKNILLELKYDNDNIKKVSLLLDNKEKFLLFLKDKREIKLKNIINDLGFTLTYDLITIVEFNEKLDLKDIRNIIDKYQKENIPIFLKDLAINGNDLMALGFKGKEIGEILLELQNKVHKDKSLNTKEKLFDLSKNYM